MLPRPGATEILQLELQNFTGFRPQLELVRLL